MTTIALLHPGEMGESIGSALTANNHQVLWVSANRSEATVRRAQSRKFLEMSSLRAALEKSTVCFAVCPPEFALDTANEVAACNFSGVYVDANAISPKTAHRVASLFDSNYVDAGIIGPPAWRDGTTRIYLSGPHRESVADLFKKGFVDVRTLDERPFSASALKMCYASYTKGTTALLLALRAVAHNYGVVDPLMNEWEVSQPGLADRTHRAGPNTSRKGWRFQAEMQEIASTYQSAGLPGEFHLAAAEVYRRMAPFKDLAPAGTEQVIDQLLQSDD